MLNFVGTLLAKLVASLFGEWRRDVANRKLGASELRAETAEATLAKLREFEAKKHAIDDAIFGSGDPDWARRLRDEFTGGAEPGDRKP